MFGKKKDKEISSQLTIVGENVIITGDILCKGVIRIDGNVKGNVISKEKVVIGKSGSIIGDISSNNLDVEGVVNGNIKATSNLAVRKTAKINGTVEAQNLSIENGAKFNATSKTITKVTTQKTEPIQQKKAEGKKEALNGQQSVLN